MDADTNQARLSVSHSDAAMPTDIFKLGLPLKPLQLEDSQKLHLIKNHVIQEMLNRFPEIGKAAALGACLLPNKVSN